MTKLLPNNAWEPDKGNIVSVKSFRVNSEALAFLPAISSVPCLVKSPKRHNEVSEMKQELSDFQSTWKDYDFNK